MIILVTTSVLIDIIDPQALRAYALERALTHQRVVSGLNTLADYAVEAMITSCPGPAPQQIGFDIDQIETHQLPVEPPRRKCPIVPVETWKVEIQAAIYDEERLRAYAAKRYAICWNHDLTFRNNPEQAVYEALIGSSEGPPTVDYGVRIQRIAYRKARKA